MNSGAGAASASLSHRDPPRTGGSSGQAGEQGAVGKQ